MKLLKYYSILLIIIILSQPIFSQNNRISYNGQELFLSGANLAWLSFATDIGPGETNYKSFADIMLDMHDHGGNALRWWLHTNGTVTPAFNSSNSVVGPGEGTITDLKIILDLAWEREIGLILCLWSFDMLRQSNDPVVLDRNFLMLTDTTYMDVYINNALIPMVDSLKGHPAIIAWEIFNEPEGMSEEFGWTNIDHVPMADIQRFVNRCAGAIHRTDPTAQVTNGSWSFIALSDVTLTKQAEIEAELSDLSAAQKEDMELGFRYKYGIDLTAEEIATHIEKAMQQANYNYYSDERLIAAGGDSVGTLDFCSVHYYDWAGTALSPFHHAASSWALDKPIVVAEFNMQDTFGVPEESLFPTLYVSGYAGVLPWSWTDTNFSTPEQMLNAMQYMWDNYRESVDVDGIGGDWPLVTLTSPDSNAIFDEGEDVVLEAEASDNDGYVTIVEFFASDTSRIGEDGDAPYTVTWTDPTVGIYTLTAIATDDQGHQRISNRVPITIGTPQMTRHEAEAAIRQGTPVVVGDPTASGGACVRSEQTGTITWAFSGVPKDSTYEMIIGYRLPFDTPKNQYLNINGERFTEIVFDNSLNTWFEKKIDIDLTAGWNEIQIEMSWGWMDFDYITLPNTFINVTRIENDDIAPAVFTLEQNFPNPFNPATTIRYSLPSAEHVQLVIYDLTGRRVKTLINKRQNAGSYRVNFNAGRLSSGVYYYRLEAGEFRQVRRMMLLK